MELQYTLELYLAGMLDTGQRGGDIRSALLELRKREEAWNKYQPIREFDIQLSGWLGSGRNIVAREFNATMGAVEFRQITPEPLWGLPERWELKFDFSIQLLFVYPEVDLLVISSDPRYAPLHL